MSVFSSVNFITGAEMVDSHIKCSKFLLPRREFWILPNGSLMVFRMISLGQCMLSPPSRWLWWLWREDSDCWGAAHHGCPVLWYLEREWKSFVWVNKFDENKRWAHLGILIVSGSWCFLKMCQLMLPEIWMYLCFAVCFSKSGFSLLLPPHPPCPSEASEPCLWQRTYLMWPLGCLWPATLDEGIKGKWLQGETWKRKWSQIQTLDVQSLFL